jgi:carboxypeptidase C (cathepsin A)
MICSRILVTLLLTLLTPLVIAQSASKIFPPFKMIQADQVNYLPHYGAVSNLQLAGHLPIKPQTDDANLFYWFVASKNDPSRDPIILWLNGGPGSSSFYGFFTENGPYYIDANGQLHDQAISWINAANYLMIDNPIGVGYSYADPKRMIHHEHQVAIDLAAALDAFYQRYPEFAHNALYLAGESYAGKYLPELASEILKHYPAIHLRGIMAGDAWVDPLIQQGSVADYVYFHGLIDAQTYQKNLLRYQNCRSLILQAKDDLTLANKACMKVNDFAMQAAGVDRHNIQTLSQINYQPVERYLNQADVKKALHVDPRVKHFSLFSDPVAQNLEPDIQKSDLHLYELLLAEHLPILIYSGLEDASDSNFLGTDRWLAELDWPHKNAFAQAKTCIWRTQDHDVAGYFRGANELAQVKIRKAGHMAPMDQPAHVLDMVQRFIERKDFCS